LVALFETASKNNANEVLYAEAAEVELLLDERFGSAGRTASTDPEIAFGNLQIQSETNPRTLDPLDVLVCRGEFGVAENGAIYLLDSALVIRAAPFLATHLIILLDQTQIVANMHEAYDRIQIDADSFSVFVAGPSKTADIEQSLVVGAQGPKSQTIVLVSGKYDIK
jgi:L-lactate dehydrogenase complex protein LldG